MKNYILLALGLLLFVSCQKDEIMDYALDGKVYFFERTSMGGSNDIKVTSKSYSFAVKSDAVTKDTMKVITRLMGNVVDRDRTFRAEVVPDSTTAVAGTHYKILDGVLKAGQYLSYLPVEIYRTADTKTTEVTLCVKLVDTSDLTTGNPTDITFHLTWGDKLIKPTNWPYFWGTYSDTKYRFAILQLGQTDWPTYTRWITVKTPGYYTAAELVHDAEVLNTAYATYKKTNGPIYMTAGDATSGEIHYGI
jgi:hypothetical protein